MSTIKSSREIDQVFKTGRRAAHPLVVVLVGNTPSGRDPRGRVAFIAGKKTGNAVKRNRAKRLLRAAASASGAPWAGRDVALIARPGTAEHSSDELAAAILALLQRAGMN